MEFARWHVKRCRQKRPRCGWKPAVRCLSLTIAGVVLSISVAIAGAFTIAGNGPELRVIEPLT